MRLYRGRDKGMGFISSILTFSAILLFGHFLVCSNKTHGFRSRLIEAIFMNNQNRSHHLELFERSSDGQDILLRMLYRDWRSAYPRELREAFPELFNQEPVLASQRSKSASQLDT